MLIIERSTYFRVFADSHIEEGALEPVTSGIETGDGAEGDFGVEVFGDVLIECAFDNRRVAGEVAILPSSKVHT